MTQTQYVCPDCGRSFMADSNADTVKCPNGRTCGGEIDVNESRRRKDERGEKDGH